MFRAARVGAQAGLTWKCDVRMLEYHAPDPAFLSPRTNLAQKQNYPCDTGSGGQLWRAEDSLQVLCAMEYAHYFQSQVGRTVEDEIALN